jgi:hypothetical protein
MIKPLRMEGQSYLLPNTDASHCRISTLTYDGRSASARRGQPISPALAKTGEHGRRAGLINLVG